jgi:hypothetical protein
VFSRINYFLSAAIILKLLISTASVVAAPVYPKVGSILIYNCTGAVTGELKSKIFDIYNGRIFSLRIANPQAPTILKRLQW